MKLISRDELKEKLDRGDSFKLVMAMGEWAFRAKHIPGSMNLSDPEKGLEMLQPDEEIVLYCSNEHCAASQYAYSFLEANRYQNLRRYAGGIEEWEESGLPLEGEWVGKARARME